MNRRYRVDLHTHSIGSYDGGLTTDDYRRAFSRDMLDVVAITDHGGIETARKIRYALSDVPNFMQRIIIGQELASTEGEIIGLYLQESIPDNLSPEATVAAIKEQGGIVYIPHPFETVRKGIGRTALERIRRDVSLIEVCNGRAIFQNKGAEAAQWAAAHTVPGVAASDAHGWAGWGRTYIRVPVLPERASLVRLASMAARKDNALATGKVGFGVLYPKLNRLLHRHGRYARQAEIAGAKP